MSDFKIGDTVVIKESNRQQVKDLYSTGWTFPKTMLGIKAADGEELTVVAKSDDTLHVTQDDALEELYLDECWFEKIMRVERKDFLSLL